MYLGSKCEFLHAAPNAADACINDKVEKDKDAVDYELELSSGGFGFDILERDATAVEESV